VISSVGESVEGLLMSRNKNTAVKGQNTPSNEEYLALYQAAGQLRAQKPWDTLGAGDLVGVRDPETGVTGYCGLLGQMGEYFALHVYLGGEGMDAYRALVDAGDDLEGEPSQLNLMLAGRSQKNLVVDFSDAAEVSPVDKARVKRLGLSIREKCAWPVFMRNDPCFEHRDLDCREVRFLTTAIREVLSVTARVRDDGLVLPEPFLTEKVLVRVPVYEDGVLVWKDVIEVLETSSVPESDPLSESDRGALEGMPVRELYLELAHTILPATIKVHESDRGMLTRMLIATDGRSGKVLGFYMFEPGEFPGGAVRQVASMLKTLGFIPSRLVMNDRWLFAAFGNAVPALRSSLALSNRMEASEDAFLAISQFMRGGHRGT